MDFVEGPPKSQGYSVIFVVVDRLTKYAHFLAIKHPYTAATIAQTFMDNVVKLHGLPQSIVTDRDTIFVSSFWKELFKLYQVNLKLSSAYHPQTDRQTERVNQCVEMFLRCAVQDSRTTWKAWLSLAELWYNSSYHSSIGCSPFKALYGYEPNVGATPTRSLSTSPSVAELVENRELHLKALKQHMAAAQNRMKLMADRHCSDLHFQKGDQVLLKLQPYTQSSVANWPHPKLSYKYYGLYTVVKRIGNVAYRLNLPHDSKIHNVFHVSQLKPFIADYSPMFSDLPRATDIVASNSIPEEVIDRRLVRKGNTATPQVLIKWSGLPDPTTTWEEYNIVRQRFPDAPAWGQAPSSAGGAVTPTADKV